MKIISYNIQYGKGTDGRFDLVRSCEAVRGADLICLQEVEQYWKRSGDVDQAAEIGGLLPTYYCVYGASFDVDASARAAHGAVVNRRRRQGNMILSRWPILSSRCFNLPKQHYADKFNMQMSFIEAVIACPPRPLRLYNYHAGYLEPDERGAQVAEFAAVFNRAVAERGAWSGACDIGGVDWSDGSAAPPMPASAVVCGDFNANPETSEYRQLLESTGLVDCWPRLDPRHANAPTLRSGGGVDAETRGKIDHIFVTTDLSEQVAGVEIDELADASDHKPVQVLLELA